MTSTMKMEETLLQIMLSFPIYLGLLLCSVAFVGFYFTGLNRGFQHFIGC